MPLGGRDNRLGRGNQRLLAGQQTLDSLLSFPAHGPQLGDQFRIPQPNRLHLDNITIESLKGDNSLRAVEWDLCCAAIRLDRTGAMAVIAGDVPPGVAQQVSRRGQPIRQSTHPAQRLRIVLPRDARVGKQAELRFFLIPISGNPVYQGDKLVFPQR